MSDMGRSFEVLVVGAGPAGIAAACCAAESGARVGLVDNNPRPGGQIWRGGENHAGAPEAKRWLQRLESPGVEIISSAEVIDNPVAGFLLAQSPRGELIFHYEKLILCTGARERFLPFPGWTLPNVVGAGGLQALVKSGLDITGRKIVVAGTGPLLVAVAAFLRQHGGNIRMVAEQAPWSRLIRFGLAVAAHRNKIAQFFQLKRQLAGVPFRAGCWPITAEGSGRVESVTLRAGKKTWKEPCDFLACGFHLVPNTELASLLGCELRAGFVRVDELQQTSTPGIFCAGEPTGIGGVELSLLEGQIAGYASANHAQKAREFFAERDRFRRFSIALERAFALRSELAASPAAETIVCRCEDVTLGRIRSHSSWRAAKLHTRCGMGACQGRICGPAIEFLLGWKVESVRPPIFPVPAESLTARDRATPESVST
ncbi:MAG TPA: FAD/NAD(P)-binding oxidoreductase [Candidatus Acidoferrales bacterium]|nr:FAD/NAD(P)-binding oxidoreductase [Candidatus Acidoferrales bacterium]